MSIAKPYFYNLITNISDDEYNKAKELATNKFSEYEKLIINYNEWRNLVKSFNKFIRDKNRRREYSRYAWHKEKEEFDKRKEKFETATREEIIRMAYNDSFYYKDELYYPVEYPQIFRVALSLNSINQIFDSAEKAISNLQNLPETCILGITDEDHIEWKEISNNISKFFDEYKNGLLYISNGR